MLPLFQLFVELLLLRLVDLQLLNEFLDRLELLRPGLMVSNDVGVVKLGEESHLLNSLLVVGVGLVQETLLDGVGVLVEYVLSQVDSPESALPNLLDLLELPLVPHLSRQLAWFHRL